MVISKGDAIDWYQETVQNRKLTEELLKIEATKFFGQDIENFNKRTISTKLKKFKCEHDNLKRRVSRLIINDNISESLIVENNWRNQPFDLLPIIKTNRNNNDSGNLHSKQAPLQERNYDDNNFKIVNVISN